MKKLTALSLVFFICFHAFPLASIAQECLDYLDLAHQRGRLLGQARVMEMSEYGLCLSPLWSSRIGIWSPGTFYESETISFDNYLDLGNYITGIKMQDNKAFVAIEGTGVSVCDVSDPTNILELASVSVDILDSGIAVAGDYVFVYSANQEIVVIDASDDSHPFIATTLPLALAESHFHVILETDGTNLLIGNTDLTVVNIVNPTMPSLLGSVTFDGRAKSFAMYESMVYIPTGGLGLKKCNIVDPFNPTISGTITTDGIPVHVEVMEDNLFVSSGSAGSSFFGIETFDIGNPDVPVPGIKMGSQNYLDTTPVLAVGHGMALVQSGPEIISYRVSDLDPLEPLGVVQGFFPQTNQVVVSGNTAVALAGANFLQTFDITDPANAQYLGFVLADPSLVVDLAPTNGSVVLALTANGLSAVDVSEPNFPEVIGTYYGFSGAMKIHENNGFAYVIGNGGGWILDVNNPANIQLVTGSLFGGSDFAVAGNTICTLHDNILDIQNIDDPSMPQLVESVVIGYGATGVEIHGNYAIVTSTSPQGRIILVDLSVQPLSSIEIFCHPFEGINTIGDIAFLKNEGPGYTVADLSSLPFVDFGSNTVAANSVLDIFPTDGVIAMASDSGVLALYPPQCLGISNAASEVPGNLSFGLSAAPNPFNPLTNISFSLDSAQQISLSVYDISGRLTTVLADKFFDSGRHSFWWNGNDAVGRKVASGVYFLVAEGEHRVEVGKVVLVK